MRPVCINHGCNSEVTFSHKDAQGNRRWRIHCSHCQAASYGKWPHRPGVTPFKQGRCENHDSRLGFDCICSLDQAPSWAKGLTEVDHIDGDYTNNDPDNLRELCVMCHKLKGQINGDFNNTKSRAKLEISVHKKQSNAKAAHDAFARLFG